MHTIRQSRECVMTEEKKLTKEINMIIDGQIIISRTGERRQERVLDNLVLIKHHTYNKTEPLFFTRTSNSDLTSCAQTPELMQSLLP